MTDAQYIRLSVQNARRAIPDFDPHLLFTRALRNTSSPHQSTSHFPELATSELRFETLETFDSMNHSINSIERNGKMAFKVFEKGSAPISSVPSVTIQKKGLFSLNDAAVKLLKDPEAIQFLWDEDEKLIALKAVSVETPNAYPTRRQGVPKAKMEGSRGPLIVAGTLFTKFIDLDTSQARRWMPRLEGDLLIIDLKTEGQLVVSNRSRGQKDQTTEA